VSQDTYPSKLKLFKAWAKAMEDGANVDKPNYGKTQSGSQMARPRSRRLGRRRTHPRRMRKKKKMRS